MKKSKAILIFLSIIVFSVLSVHAQDNRTIKNFHGIANSGAFEVYVRMGDKESIEVEGSEEDLERIETIVQNGILRIRTKRNINNWNEAVNVVKIYITAIKLDALMQSGSGIISVEGDLNSANADIQVSGSGQIKVGLKTQSASITLSGSGNLVLDGKVGNLKITMSGSGDVNADKLIAETVKVKLAGNGVAYVYAESELEAAIVGPGEVKYLGNPNITTSKLGNGKVSKM
ncbi:head GIN domain-containing protein [Pedobacter alpinus]|uniref:Head GIN domain-containing protein n=1 Tax=Pedobacter alpinus TaxID=1590643 RepID=A0ABW5TWP9_9SPHI